MTESSDCWFETLSGRDVLLSAIHIRSFAGGCLEGSREFICNRVLAGLKGTAKSLLPGTSAVYIDPLPVTPNTMPRLIYFCDFISFEPVQPIANFSSLAVVWYADDLSQTIPDFLTPRMKSVSWEKFAADGYW